MAKLTRAQAKAHAEACKMLEKDRLADDERLFVIQNWQESANHVNSSAGAFFTPWGLARDFSIEVGGARTIIDLCAGVGTLAYFSSLGDVERLVCVEKNPGYIAVGRKLVPHAEWVEGDVFDLPEFGRFDCAISNPPFGATARTGTSRTYSGRAFEYHVIAVASEIASYGVFIIPQNSAPFRYSGERHYREEKTEAYNAFAASTGIDLTPNCGIDCEVYRKDWRGVAPAVEIVCADFQKERGGQSAQADLFEAA